MGNIVTLTQVRTHLGWPNPTQTTVHDGELQLYINAADECVEFECDDIMPKQHDEPYDGGGTQIHLLNRPLLSVENVEEGWGWINYELDYQEVNSPPPVFSLYAYSIDSYPNAILSRRSAGNVVIPFRPGDGNIRVQYTSGLQAIPGAVLMAELELIAHWWRNSQLRAVTMAGANLAYDAVAGAAYTRDTEAGNQNINVGVPFAILEFLKSYRRTPIIA